MSNILFTCVTIYVSSSVSESIIDVVVIYINGIFYGLRGHQVTTSPQAL